MNKFILLTVFSLSMTVSASVYSCNGWKWIGANLLDGCNSCNQDCGQESNSTLGQTSGGVNEVAGAAGGF